MIIDESQNKIWFCDTCSKLVAALHAIHIGLFCMECGAKVRIPDKTDDPVFYDEDDKITNDDEFLTGDVYDDGSYYSS